MSTREISAASMEPQRSMGKKNQALSFDRSTQWNIFGAPAGERCRVTAHNVPTKVPMKLLDDAVLTRLEKDFAAGVSSAEILDFFVRHDISLSEATLRKYVQLGLLPRSIRVGSKGKHRGSKGIYPVGVIRQILRIKEMMAESYTIEQIQREFLFIRSDLEQLEQTLETIFDKLASVTKDRGADAWSVVRSVDEARTMSRDLLGKLEAIEQRLVSGAKIQSVATG